MDSITSTDRHQRSGTGTAREEYLNHIFSHVPLYTTRLVRERDIPLRTRGKLRMPEDVVAFLSGYFKDKDREEFLALYLDTAMSVTSISQISVGGLASTIVEPRQIFKVAVLSNAASMILAHNHPSGNPQPSREDISITRQIKNAGKIMGIPVRDHIIIGDESYVSFIERGLI